MKTLVRSLGAVALAIALTGAPRAAAADPIGWQVFPDGTGAWFSPTTPTDFENTILQISGPWPFACARVTEAVVLDSAHVSLVYGHQPACPDSMPLTCGIWLDLGRYAAGPHSIEVRRRIVWPDGHVTEEASSHDFVVAHVDPPPPPPLGTVFLSIRTDPVVAEAGDPVTLLLAGQFPYACGQVVDARVVSPTDVRLTLRPGPSPCGDTTRTWAESFPLGAFPAGDYLVWARATIEGAGDLTADSIAVGLHVGPDVPPPGDTSAVHLSWAPESPGPNDPVTLIVRGMFPTGCGQITATRMPDPHHVEVDLLDDNICASPPRPWEQTFDLGVLPSGTHDVRARVTLQSRGEFFVDSAWARIVVSDLPAESLSVLMSPATPNPFRDESRFSVSLDRPAAVDLGVFDVNGRRVATVHRGVLPAGRSQMAWNGRGPDGRYVASGIYFYRLALPDRIVSKRVVLLAHP